VSVKTVRATAIRPCGTQDLAQVLAIINDAAQAYRGVIPAERWHEPYMSFDELAQEVRNGVAFWGCDSGGRLVGVMGTQDRDLGGAGEREMGKIRAP
jgi:hypothetical protein